MQEPDPIQGAARLFAAEEWLALLLAQHYSPNEMAAIALDHHQCGDRLLRAPDGAVMHPSALTDTVKFIAAIQHAKADLFVRAGEAYAKHIAGKATATEV
ncbi:MAG TPA: hypothetical protein VGI79_07105 [Caulobacteraceae bacterium]